MRDYSVLNGMIENQKSELRTAYDKGYNQGVRDTDFQLAISKRQDEAYKQGLHDAWECAREIARMEIKALKDAGLITIYDDTFEYSCRILELYPVEEAMKKIKEYDEKTFDVPDNCKIEVGDEVRDDMFDKVGVVIRIADNHAYVLEKDGIGTWTLDAVVKTGNHFEEVSDMMKHLENTDE